MFSSHIDLRVRLEVSNIRFLFSCGAEMRTPSLKVLLGVFIFITRVDFFSLFY